MVEWLVRVGYSADIPRLQTEFPEGRLGDFRRVGQEPGLEHSG